MPDDHSDDPRAATPSDEAHADPAPQDDGVDGATVEEALFEPLDRLAALLLELDRDPTTVVTSVRVPRPLRDALGVAVELGYERSVNDALVRAARDRLGWMAQRHALDAHYEQYPWTRPTLTDLALATAKLCADPLHDEPELVAEAARFVEADRPDGTGDEVLLVARALAAERAA